MFRHLRRHRHLSRLALVLDALVEIARALAPSRPQTYSFVANFVAIELALYDPQSSPFRDTIEEDAATRWPCREQESPCRLQGHNQVQYLSPPSAGQVSIDQSVRLLSSTSTSCSAWIG